MAGSIVPILEERLETIIVNYFKSNNALSVENAIIPDKKDIGFKDIYSESYIDLNRYNYLIRESGTDKYYLDEKIYLRNQRIKIALLLSIGLSVLAVTIFVFVQLITLIS